MRRGIHFKHHLNLFFSLILLYNMCARPCAQIMPRTCVQISPIAVYIFIIIVRTYTQHIYIYTHLQLAIHPCKNVRLHIFMASLPFYNSNDIVFFLLVAFYIIFFYFFSLSLSIWLFKRNSTHFFYCSWHDKTHEKWCGEQQMKNRSVCVATATPAFFLLLLC